LDVVSDIKREIERISNTVMLRYRDCDDERCLQQKLDKFPTYKLSREPFLAGLNGNPETFDASAPVLGRVRSPYISGSLDPGA